MGKLFESYRRVAEEEVRQDKDQGKTSVEKVIKKDMREKGRKGRVTRFMEELADRMEMMCVCVRVHLNQC